MSKAFNYDMRNKMKADGIVTGDLCYCVYLTDIDCHSFWL